MSATTTWSRVVADNDLIAGFRERMDGEMLRARLLELFDEQER